MLFFAMRVEAPERYGYAIFHTPCRHFSIAAAIRRVVFRRRLPPVHIVRCRAQPPDAMMFSPLPFIDIC